jgi:hypothetical protein
MPSALGAFERPPPDKALQLTANSALQLWFGSPLAFNFALPESGHVVCRRS